MLSKTEFMKYLLLILILGSAIYFARANAENVCHTRPGDNIQQIDIFDGKPEELAYLAPDDEKAAPNIYTLGYIYDQGRVVTIRCKYNSGFVADVELKGRVTQCKSLSNKSGDMSLACK
jgi:hypothetical protein